MSIIKDNNVMDRWKQKFSSQETTPLFWEEKIA